jgi:hypothetical protein
MPCSAAAHPHAPSPNRECPPPRPTPHPPPPTTLPTSVRQEYVDALQGLAHVKEVLELLATKAVPGLAASHAGPLFSGGPAGAPGLHHGPLPTVAAGGGAHAATAGTPHVVPSSTASLTVCVRVEGLCPLASAATAATTALVSRTRPFNACVVVV